MIPPPYVFPSTSPAVPFRPTPDQPDGQAFVATDDVVDRPRRAACQLMRSTRSKRARNTAVVSRIQARSDRIYRGALATTVPQLRAMDALLSDLSDQRAAGVLWFYFGHQSGSASRRRPACSNRAEVPRDDVTMTPRARRSRQLADANLKCRVR